MSSRQSKVKKTTKKGKSSTQKAVRSKKVMESSSPPDYEDGEVNLSQKDSQDIGEDEINKLLHINFQLEVQDMIIRAKEEFLAKIGKEQMTEYFDSFKKMPTATMTTLSADNLFDDAPFIEEEENQSDHRVTNSIFRIDSTHSEDVTPPVSDNPEQVPPPPLSDPLITHNSAVEEESDLEIYEPEEIPPVRQVSPPRKPVTNIPLSPAPQDYLEDEEEFFDDFSDEQLGDGTHTTPGANFFMPPQGSNSNLDNFDEFIFLFLSFLHPID